ncbi:MAG: hypothetical protein ABH832_02065 [bacterium]
MNKIIPILFLLLSKPAFADPTFKASAGLGLGMAFTDKTEKAVPPSVKLDLGMIVPMSKRWVWYSAIGASVPMSAYSPSLRLVTGPGLKLSKSWSIGATILYQLNPAYEEKSWSHILAISVAPSVTITKEISLAFVAGPGVLLSDEDPLWSIAFQPKISFRLPNLW